MMRLGSILAPNETREIIGDPDVEISEITSDSRKAGKGSLFACISGAHVDGHEYAGQAAGAQGNRRAYSTFRTIHSAVSSMERLVTSMVRSPGIFR